MEENGMPDERDTFLELGLPQDLYIPGVLLYYNDDLKFEEQEMLNAEKAAWCWYNYDQNAQIKYIFLYNKTIKW